MRMNQQSMQQNQNRQQQQHQLQMLSSVPNMRCNNRNPRTHGAFNMSMQNRMTPTIAGSVCSGQTKSTFSLDANQIGMGEKKNMLKRRMVNDNQCTLQNPIKKRKT